MNDEERRKHSNRHPETWSRRGAIGALAAGAATLVGCGDGSEAGGGAGQSGSGGAGGSAGAGSGGSAGAGASGGVAGQPGTGGAGGGSAGQAGGAGQAGQGGAAGASSLECKQTGPTPGCKITEDNILGPFYKAGAPFRKDITDGAVGERLVIRGKVYGCDCVTPLPGAEVDIWQADADGAYDSVGYRLRGKLATDANGAYEFESILPGFYLNGATYRPRHVHYKVSHGDFVALTTQLYFEGDPYIPTDPFVRASLVKPLNQQPAPGGGTLWVVSFDIVLA